jgi:hypothetical protein
MVKRFDGAKCIVIRIVFALLILYAIVGLIRKTLSAPVFARKKFCALFIGDLVAGGSDVLSPRYRITPAMAAGLSDHVWSLEELINLVNVPFGGQGQLI